jgi:hypothetical protein
MAKQQSTPSSCPQDTILSRHITSGTAHFSAISGVWSSSQGPEPCVAFDVTWDGRETANHFRGYSIRVQLTPDVIPGALALVASKEGLQLAIKCDGGFADAITNELIDKALSVVGPVVQEREYRTAKQMRTHSCTESFENVKSTVNAGFAIAATWEEDDEADFDIVTITSAFNNCRLYQNAKDYYRGQDKNHVTKEEDFALRLFAAGCFAAGRASALVAS